MRKVIALLFDFSSVKNKTIHATLGKDTQGSLSCETDIVVRAVMWQQGLATVHAHYGFISLRS